MPRVTCRISRMMNFCTSRALASCIARIGSCAMPHRRRHAGVAGGGPCVARHVGHPPRLAPVPGQGRPFAASDWVERKTFRPPRKTFKAAAWSRHVLCSPFWIEAAADRCSMHNLTPVALLCGAWRQHRGRHTPSLTWHSLCEEPGPHCRHSRFWCAPACVQACHCTSTVVNLSFACTPPQVGDAEVTLADYLALAGHSTCGRTPCTRAASCSCGANDCGLFNALANALTACHMASLWAFAGGPARGPAAHRTQQGAGGRCIRGGRQPCRRESKRKQEAPLAALLWLGVTASCSALLW